MKNPFNLLIQTLLLLSPILLQTGTCDKILVVAFFSSKSHKLTYFPLIEELGKRGHNITVITPIKPSKTLQNIREYQNVDWERFEAEMFAKGTWDPIKTKESKTTFNPFFMLDMFDGLCKASYSSPIVKQVLKEEWNLVFLQPFLNDCVLGLVHKIQAPFILFAPFSVGGFQVEKLGGHFPPSFTPNIMLAYPEEMNFFRRFVNFGFNLMFEVILRFYYEPSITQIYREALDDPEIPPVHLILREASLILSNGHFTMHRPKPLLPDIIEVGGLHSFVEKKPLPSDLEDFIKKGRNGFIFFSMGSAIRGNSMSEEKRKMFLKVFSGLDYQVIWKWETEMEDLPNNVLLSKWLPQQDLLGHSEIKLFITHCGGGGTEESIYHGVPMVGIPMFGDQMINAKLAKAHDIIVELDWNELSEAKLMGAIKEVLDNKKYAENAKKLSILYKDQPDEPMKRAVYWVEYVLRHKGAKHLRSVGRKLNWFEYHSYDVILTYLGILSVIIYVTFSILRWTIRKICGNKKTNVKSKNE